jgi:hypothetical protein
LCSGLGWNNWFLKKLFCGRYKEVRRLAVGYSMYLKGREKADRLKLMDLDLKELIFVVGVEQYWGNDRVEMVDVAKRRKEGVDHGGTDWKELKEERERELLESDKREQVKFKKALSCKSSPFPILEGASSHLRFVLRER